jgi:hypothetical protein
MGAGRVRGGSAEEAKCMAARILRYKFEVFDIHFALLEARGSVFG